MLRGGRQCDRSGKPEGDLPRPYRRSRGRGDRTSARDLDPRRDARNPVRGQLHQPGGAGRSRHPRSPNASSDLRFEYGYRGSGRRPAALQHSRDAALPACHRDRRRLLRPYDLRDDRVADRHGRSRTLGGSGGSRHSMAHSRHVRTELLHGQADGAFREGEGGGRRTSSDRLFGCRGSRRVRHRPLLGFPHPPRRWLELRLHRRDVHGGGLLPAFGAQQGPGRERLPSLRHGRLRILLCGIASPQLRLGDDQLVRAPRCRPCSRSLVWKSARPLR